MLWMGQPCCSSLRISEITSLYLDHSQSKQQDEMLSQKQTKNYGYIYIQVYFICFFSTAMTAFVLQTTIFVNVSKLILIHALYSFTVFYQ